MPLSVLTLNIWNYEGPWAERLDLIRGWIRLLDPDLIGLQEVLLGEQYDQASEIFDGMNYQLDYAGPMAYWDDASLQFGNLAASRWPITESRHVLLPMAGRSDQRVLLCTSIDSPHGRIAFYVTHLTSKPYDGWIREQQVQVIGETILSRRSLHDLPAILCGDFNAEPESTEMRYMRGQHSLGGRSFFMLDAWRVAGGDGPGHTFTRQTPYRRYRQFDQRLDYIYVERVANDAARVAHCGLVCNTPRRGLYPSDHLGVFMTLALPGEDSGAANSGAANSGAANSGAA